MAELFSTYAANEILKTLQTIVTDTIKGAWTLKDDLLKLSDSMGRLQSLLQKVHYVPDAEDDESIKRWLEKLQRAVYAAADVMDEFQYEILRCKVEVKRSLKRKVHEFVSCNNPILFRVNMTFKVKEVSASLADMEKEAPLVLLTITIPVKTVDAEYGVVVHNHPDRTTDSFLGKSERPIGRANEVERIIQMLQVGSVDNAAHLSVISIVGFGGLGKTTLAQFVFQEAEKKQLFDEKMWVCVSEPFDIQKILGEMLQRLDKTTGGLSSMDAIVSNLRVYLKHKRFLLVLDDVWNEESAKWNNLKTRLENISDKSGNFVIATTRSSVVANIMGTHPMCMVILKQLSDIECWSVIKERVVGNEGKSIIPYDMEIIGMEIANKCGGVPLAAKVVGGVLSSRYNKAEWLSIQHSNVWNEVDEHKRIMSVLKLSFDHLRPPQKLCFAYCAFFPKDVLFEKAQLIQLWTAEEFLNTTSTDGEISAKLKEDVGEEYFHNLLVNSFFQDAQVDDCGNIVRCKMHDLLHDLALSIVKCQSLQCGPNCFETYGGCRLKFSCDQVSKVQQVLESSKDKASNLRSLFCKVDVSPMLSNFRRLRCLDMSDAKLKDLPSAIRKLKHLRYLDISKSEIRQLPESITKLYNLQTLRVFECRILMEFPSKIRNLVSLRHLGFDDKRLMPLEVGCLTHLQTLPCFVVGVQKGEKINELGELNELRGELVVCSLENVRNKAEAERAKLKEKKLSKLELRWMEVPTTEESNHGEVMEGLEAPTKIQSLAVECYMGNRFPKWMSELYKLVKLTLKDCGRCVRIPTLGHLPYLKVLIVERMNSMKSIGSEFYGESNTMDTPMFPLLEEFSIMEMKSLVEWVTPEGTEIFPKLRKFSIADCPNLTSFPFSKLSTSAICMQLRRSLSRDLRTCMEIWGLSDFKSLEELFINECPRLRFLHIDLTSLLKFHFYLEYSSLQQKELVKTLSQHSNHLGGSRKTMFLEGTVEIVKEFPKSLEALQRFDDELSVEAFSGLSCLKCLLIIQCHVLELIPTLSSLTSLKHVTISYCSRLKEIPSLSSLTSLEHLTIAYCNSLQSISSLSSLSSLKHLQIHGCYNLRSVLGGLTSSRSLKILDIVGCENLSELWPGSFSTLTSLNKLLIGACGNLRSLPSEIKSCTSLEELSVVHCIKMESIDDDIMGSLTRLKVLEWGGFSKALDNFPGLSSIHLLTSLRKLKIIGWKKLSSLPRQLQHLASIIDMEIWHFDGVESLPDWFCNLKSLQRLKIQDCKNLKSLPKDMRRLSKLTTLGIMYCPLLTEKCCKDDEPEWLNISHIQHIEIDYEVKQHLR